MVRLIKRGPKRGLFVIIRVFLYEILSLHFMNLYSKIRKLDGNILSNKFLGKGDR